MHFFLINTFPTTLKHIQVKFFSLDQNVGISLKRILTKFEASTPSRFQDFTVQN